MLLRPRIMSGNAYAYAQVQTSLKGAVSQFAYLEKFNLNFSS